MRLSFDWLSDYVDLSGLNPQEVADRLTMGAFEVEEVKKVGPDIEGPVVVGEIVEINPHPNADKIRLTKVKIDAESDPLDIVCGAQNIIVGQRIPVALPGARVINRHDGTPLPIKLSKIRGVESNGMLCSPPELGVTDGESEGILVLYGLPDLGTDVKKMMHLYPDYILHVEPRSNRGDALSVKGLAREVAALFDRPLMEPAWELPPPDRTSEKAQIFIENLEECPYFSIRIIQGLMVKPSGFGITRRLEAVGVRPVNNIVDITNYVLHELGQPLHAYDLAQLKGPVVEVRRGRGEKLTTLDGRERELTEEVLIIADSERPVGVAGVMGGKDSEVTDDTSFVALEAAAFAPARVRRSGRLLGLSSDSSLRFERGVDVASVRRASDRATYLILQSCGGFLGEITHAGSDEVKPIQIPVRLPRITQLLDVEVGKDEVATLLKPLGFDVAGGASNSIEVSVPSFRQRDVAREIDVIEEVCRLYGYDKIPASMPRTTGAPRVPDPTEAIAREALSACGLNETCISSLTGPDATESHSGNGSSTAISVLNPLSEDHQILRQSLLPGLVKAAAYNQDRGRKDVWLFEIGRAYHRQGNPTSREAAVREDLRVAGVICGTRDRSRWQQASRSEQTDVYAAKGVVENLLERLSIDCDSVSFDSESTKAPGWFHPARCSQIMVTAGKKAQPVAVGWLGELHPAQADREGLRNQLYIFELSLDELRALRKAQSFEEIHNTPMVSRDLTVDVSADIEQQKVYETLRRAAGSFLRSLEMVSIFDLSDREKSLSYRLTFQNPDDTLTNEQLEEILTKIRESLKSNIGGSFRA